MSRLRHWPWAIALVCVVLGFMLSMQFKVQKQVELKDLTAMTRAQDLAQQLEQAETARDESMAELEKLRQEMTKVINRQAGLEDLGRQLEEAQRAAGLVALVGQGVQVEMRDATRPLAPGENANALIIHDSDVLRVVNELFAAGAEAMSINEQRVIGRTEIVCAGPVVIVNGIRTAPPIVIKAIGDPEDLEMALMMKDGIAEELRGYGIQISIKRETNLTVPAFKGSLKMQYGTPAK